MKKIDSYISREGYLCEHLTTPDRFQEFKNLEWEPGHDYEKEFEPKILVPDITYDHIVEELNHMKSNLNNDIEYYSSYRLILLYSNESVVFFKTKLRIFIIIFIH